MPPFRTHRHPHPDLTGPLGHRDQQDVHNPDAADQERDGGHGRQHEVSVWLVPSRTLASSTWVLIVKSSGSSGWSRWRTRRTSWMASTASGSSSCDSAEAYRPLTEPRNCVPRTFRSAVVKGMNTMSSWSDPPAECPLGASPPITVNATFLSRIVDPSGSSPRSY